MVLFFAAVGGGLFFCPAARGEELKDEFYQDFRSPKFPPTSILDIARGEGEQKIVKREAGGVRVAVAGKESGFPPFGVSPRFHVSGDFEITASYEVVKLDKPTSGYGVSVTLWVMTDKPSVDAVCVSRSNRPWDGSVWVADKGWWDVSEKKYHHDGQAFPTQCKGGKLRLVRTGSVVHFLVAEGDSQDFQELRQVDYNTEDLSQIHLGVDTGGSKGPVEIVLKDLRIRAEELPLAGATKRQTSRSWLIWLAAGLVGLGAVAASALYVWKSARAKRAARKSEEPAQRLQRSKA